MGGMLGGMLHRALPWVLGGCCPTLGAKSPKLIIPLVEPRNCRRKRAKRNAASLIDSAPGFEYNVADAKRSSGLRILSFPGSW
jgi:hypothetical protein